MEISKTFAEMFSSETATSVPITHEVMSTFRQGTGIGDKGVALSSQGLKETSLDLTQTLPKDIPTEEQMSTMPFYDLQQLREKHSGNKIAQNYIAPYEHRAMNREIIKEDSALGKLLDMSALSVAMPVYAAGKATGILPSDKDTSSQYGEELKQGFIGIGEGLLSFFTEDKEATPQSKSPEEQKKSELTSTVDNLLNSLINVESEGKHTNEDGSLTTSKKGALGITQIMPATAKNPGYGITPLKNETQEEYIRFGREYLYKMIDVFDNIEQGIAAYNAGPGAVHRAIAKAGRTGRDWKEFIPKETQEYIRKVAVNTESTPHKRAITAVLGVRG